MTSQQIVDLLNEALRLDPTAINAMMRQRYPCNDAIGDHPSIVVDFDGNDHEPEWRLSISALGLLQGIAALDGHHIWGIYDDQTYALIGFKIGPL